MPLVEFVSATLSEVLASFTVRGIIKLFDNFPVANEDSDPQSLYMLPPKDPNDEPTVISAGQLIKIGELLTSVDAQALISAYALAFICDEAQWVTASSTDRIEQAFDAFVNDWCAGRNLEWAALSKDIWNQVTTFLNTILPNPADLSFKFGEEYDGLRSYLGEPLMLSGGERARPVYIRDLVAIAERPERLESLRNTTYDIRAAVKASYAELRIQHSQEDLRFSISDLYVERNLLDPSIKTHLPSVHLFRTDSERSNYVIIGDPGVGKSTLVGHVIHSISQNASHFAAPLLLRCRDYAAMQPPPPLLDAIASWLSVEFSLNSSTEELRDILSLGRAVVVLDGVDEILDIGRRRDFIKQVEAFSRRFPLVRIVVTSRKVGYAKASFSPSSFRVLELQEFTDDQVDEYTRRWFKLTKRDELDRQAFVRESTSIADIRANPLMLSLLCTLYRMRGFIPQNRRHVYRECAELLFNRWDSMRHIDQPYDHRHYGQRLIQELALFYYRSQSAQAGVEERQLRHIIANFFQDTGGTEFTSAETRARDFLDFCADRAWLLTKKGTSSYGDRVFGFTHRTFMEYFAAEALVRRVSGVEEITNEVVKAYDTDQSSVLADVIVQCFDEKQDRGAEQIIQWLLAHSRERGVSVNKYLVLCLRIINTCPVNAQLATRILTTLLESWGTSPPHSSCVALFELYRDPRMRLMRILQDEQEDERSDFKLNASFARAWARYIFTEYSFMYEKEWEDFANQVVAFLAEHSVMKDIPFIDLCIKQGNLNVSSLSRYDIRQFIMLTVYDKPQPGAILSAVADCLIDHPAAASAPVREFASLIPKIKEINEYYAQHIKVAWGMLGVKWSKVEWNSISNNIDPDLRAVLMWTCCVLIEIEYPATHPFAEAVDYVVGLQNFGGLLACHLSRNGIDDVCLPNMATGQQCDFSPLTQSKARAIYMGFPQWLRRWTNGKKLVTVNADDYNRYGK